ncbi:MAG: LemA family protein [Ruminiclostridium sp.]|nr:LemA family protein [Ruminiclostridium sp.]
MKKKTGLTVIIVIVALLLLVVGGTMATYNGLVQKEENVDSALADLDVMLQRRADLIPNLINTVKGYVEHENEVIDAITTAREALVGADSVADKAAANEALTGALGNLMVVVENYPDLKSSDNFIALQDELAGTENRIAVARRDYNDAVKTINAAVKKFPGKLIADMFGFESREYFEADEAANTVPEVSF